MPTRIIRDGILTSERVDRLGWQEEVFYRRLQSVADDHGRFYANSKLILAACFPLRIGKVSDSDIGKWLTACVTADLVRVYPASDGKRYVEILDFGQRIQSKSKFPECSSDSRKPTVENRGSPEPTEKNGLVVVEDEVEVEGVNTRAKRKKKVEAHALPDDFGISEAVEAWAKTKGHTRLPEHLDAFRLKAKAKGYTYVDWDAAFMEAVRNDWAKLGVPINGGSPQPPVKRRKQLGEGSSTNYSDTWRPPTDEQKTTEPRH